MSPFIEALLGLDRWLRHNEYNSAEIHITVETEREGWSMVTKIRRENTFFDLNSAEEIHEIYFPLVGTICGRPFSIGLAQKTGEER